MSTVRISGVILPPNKHIRIALRSVYGVGPHVAMEICKKAGVDPTMKTRDLREDQNIQLQEAVGNYEVEGDLRRRIATNIKRLVDIKSYRGKRHRSKLPCRGQNTQTNARTRKGPRKQQQVKK